MSIIPFPGLHPGLVCVDPLGQTGAGAHGWSTACAGRRITHPCRNGAFMPTVPIPACMPTVPFPGLHPELVCVDPLGQTAPGAFSRRRRSRRRSWEQRWTRHGASRRGDSQLSASVARCCGGRRGFLERRGGRRLAQHLPVGRIAFGGHARKQRQALCSCDAGEIPCSERHSLEGAMAHALNCSVAENGIVSLG